MSDEGRFEGPDHRDVEPYEPPVAEDVTADEPAVSSPMVATS